MPALLEPPPTRPRVRGTVFPPRPPPDPRWHDRFVRSGYFFGAVLVHLLIFALVATYVVFKAPAPPPDDTPIKINIPPAQKESPPPPPKIDQPKLNAPPINPDRSPPVIQLNGPHDFVVPIPSPNSPVSPLNAQAGINRSPIVFPPTNTPSAERVHAIKNTVIEKWHRTQPDITEGGGQPGNVNARFTVYVASYADGDWACNSVLDGQGHIVAGSLPNLVAKVREWSHNKIKATVELQPLSIGSKDLLDKMPPFIFFTGHKSFHLTEAEVDNLQKYVHNGGLIWGDNALPGYGSRFDVSFRREMSRVIPGKDKHFEPVTMDHEMFNENRWFDFNGELPSGMNYFQEPMEHIDLDGFVAILYTPNDYSDMMDLRILPGDQAYEGGWRKGLELWSNETFLENSQLYFRNFNLPACYRSQRLGANIIGYLLVRFDKLMLLNP